MYSTSKVSMWRWARAVVVAVLAANLIAPSHADLNIGVGGSFDLGGGAMDLGCTDVVVGGTLNLSGGSLTNVRSLTIQSSGILNAGSGSITLAGDWSNQGNFNAGTGSVNFVDAPACATTSTISGNSNFYRLSIVSNSGKLYRFASGSSQTVGNQLTLLGSAALPLRIEASTAGSFANINLAGNQVMANLAVRDMTASGQWLALGLSNQASGGNTINWFGFPIVPTLSSTALAALALSLAALAQTQRRRRKRIDGQ